MSRLLLRRVLRSGSRPTPLLLLPPLFPLLPRLRSLLPRLLRLPLLLGGARSHRRARGVADQARAGVARGRERTTSRHLVPRHPQRLALRRGKRPRPPQLRTLLLPLLPRLRPLLLPLLFVRARGNPEAPAWRSRNQDELVRSQVAQNFGLRRRPDSRLQLDIEEKCAVT